MLLNTAIYFRLPLKALKVTEFSMHTSTKGGFNCQFPSLIAITPRTQIGSKVASFDLDSYSKERKLSNAQSSLIHLIKVTIANRGSKIYEKIFNINNFVPKAKTPVYFWSYKMTVKSLTPQQIL